MKNLKVRNSSSKSLDRRLWLRTAREREAERRHDDELITLSSEPVPLGSGLQELGRGHHCYVKMNWMDASIRCFRFRTAAAANEAASAGVAAELSEAC